MNTDPRIGPTGLRDLQAFLAFIESGEADATPPVRADAQRPLTCDDA